MKWNGCIPQISRVFVYFYLLLFFIFDDSSLSPQLADDIWHQAFTSLAAADFRITRHEERINQNNKCF